MSSDQVVSKDFANGHFMKMRKKINVSNRKERATEILPNVQTMRVIIICTRELPFKHNDPLRAIIILQPLPGNFVFFKEKSHF